jgi:DNA primase
VFVFADGDQPGKEFATSLARELPITIIQLPDGQDVNSMFVQEGSQYFLQKVGVND